MKNAKKIFLINDEHNRIPSTSIKIRSHDTVRIGVQHASKFELKIEHNQQHLLLQTNIEPVS